MFGWVDGDGQTNSIRVLINNRLGVGRLQLVKQSWDALEKAACLLVNGPLRWMFTAIHSSELPNCLKAAEILCNTASASGLRREREREERERQRERERERERERITAVRERERERERERTYNNSQRERERENV